MDLEQHALNQLTEKALAASEVIHERMSEALGVWQALAENINAQVENFDKRLEAVHEIQSTFQERLAILAEMYERLETLERLQVAKHLASIRHSVLTLSERVDRMQEPAVE